MLLVAQIDLFYWTTLEHWSDIRRIIASLVLCTLFGCFAFCEQNSTFWPQWSFARYFVFAFFCLFIICTTDFVVKLHSGTFACVVVWTHCWGTTALTLPYFCIASVLEHFIGQFGFRVWVVPCERLRFVLLFVFCICLIIQYRRICGSILFWYLGIRPRATRNSTFRFGTLQYSNGLLGPKEYGRSTNRSIVQPFVLWNAKEIESKHWEPNGR